MAVLNWRVEPWSDRLPQSADVIIAIDARVVRDGNAGNRSLTIMGRAGGWGQVDLLSDAGRWAPVFSICQWGADELNTLLQCATAGDLRLGACPAENQVIGLQAPSGSWPENQIVKQNFLRLGLDEG